MMSGSNPGSCFGFQGHVCRLWVLFFFVFASQILVMRLFFVMRHQNIVLYQRIMINGYITKKAKNRRITKKTGTHDLQTDPRNPKQEPLLIPAS